MDKMGYASVIYDTVTFRLDDCNMLFVGLPLKMSQKRQCLQNATSHLLAGAGGSNPIIPLVSLLC